MKKNFKRAALLTMAGVMLAGTAFSAHAASLYNGQWCKEDNGYWFKLTEDGSSFLADTWYWIKDSDGVIRSYYFDQNGWLVTNQNVGGFEVNDQGQYVVNGEVQTRGENDGDYATGIDFAAYAAANTTATATAAQTVVDDGTGPAAGAATTNSARATSKKYYKSSGAGDNPANATFTQVYENSSIGGGTATNNWANFRVTIPGVSLITDDSGAGTDFYADSDEKGSLIVTYYPIDKYSQGNNSLASFIAGFAADGKGFKGGTGASAATFGPYQFEHLTKAVATPEGTTYDHAYIRQIDGTNYAMVILVEKTGANNDYISALGSMSAVR